MKEQNRKHVLNAGQYATAADFKQIFSEDINSLYLLSLLLTGSPEKAEECFVEGIGESATTYSRSGRVRGPDAPSFRVQSEVIGPRERSVTAIRTADLERVMDKVPMVLHAEVCAIPELAPFERFVFVVSVLERYSDNDCFAVRRLIILSGLFFRVLLPVSRDVDV